MALTSKQGVRPQKLTRPKQVAHPTTRTPLDGPDPLGFGTKLAKIIAEMQNAYRAPLRASLDEFLLVEFSPNSRRRMLDAPTAQGRPVSFLAEIIMYPDDASGFRRAVGTLLRIAGASPMAESDEQPDDDDSEDPPLIIDTSRNPISKSDYEAGMRKSLRRGRRR
jgi:hypothetical protein